MNKKLKQLIFGGILSLGLMIPMTDTASAQSFVLPGTPGARDAQNGVNGVGSQVRGPAPLQDSIEAINGRFAELERAVGEATFVLGPDKVIFMTGAATGTPIVTIEQDMIDTQLPIETVVAAEVIKTTCGCPVKDVVDQIEQGKNMAQVIIALGIPLRLVQLRTDVLVSVFDDEIKWAASTNRPDSQQLTAEMYSQVNTFGKRFNQMLATYGDRNFDRTLFDRLSVETGMTYEQLVTMREAMPDEITVTQFIIIVLATDSLSITGDGVINLSGINLGLADVNILTNTLINNNIPTPLLTNRVLFLQRAVKNELLWTR